ncbi:helix-turn-helix domain-containing protein [Novosphingobium sp.]|uniref:helix-turn-helix domain-containing protein n=1 Tax=Novosphingobium sp. TaxID=1874826 RepID=UPI002733FCCF|nr:helix-turn-helix domain-containing protein [Novosphingobium sp.]MDP3908709.1 helix-turn-helix domain-containing protein [Novosphingobium sp.]
MSSLVNGCDILSNSENHNPQALSGWAGDVASLVREMKRRAGVKTDQELAEFLSISQSAVANWKQRGGVPEAAILKFEEAVSNRQKTPTLRVIYARAVAMRVPAIWAERVQRKGKGGSEFIPYFTVSTSLNVITNRVAKEIAEIERATGLPTADVAMQLLSDDDYLWGIVGWLNEVSMAELLLAEAKLSRGV